MKPRELDRRYLTMPEREALIRTRLAESRADLLARSIAVREESLRKGPSLATRGLELVSVAPNVTLLAAVIVSALVVSPRKIASVIVRNGLVGWIGKSVRRRASE
jgi:hypothetical protein